MTLTVADLRQALKGIDGKTPVVIADHDHSEYESNGNANHAELMNQKNMSDYERKRLESIYIRKGNYFVIRVGS